MSKRDVARTRWGLLALVLQLGFLSSLLAPTLPVKGQSIPSTEVAETPAYQRLVDASEIPLTLYVINGFPRSVLGSFPIEGETPVQQARNFMAQHPQVYLQNDVNLNLIARAYDTDEQGTTVIFDQTYRNIDVFGGQLIFQLDGDRLISSVGGLLPEGMVIETRPTISRAEAARLARRAAAEPDAPIILPPRLMIYDPGILEDVRHALRLVWQLKPGQVDPREILIDAHTGEVVYNESLIQTEFDLDLEDISAGGAGENAANTSCYWNTTWDDQVGDEEGLFVAPDADELDDIWVETQRAWDAIHDTYAFYLDEFGLDSYDGDGGQIEVYLSAAVPNAQWVGASIDCDLIEFRFGWVAFDVMVHEFTHGVAQFRSQGQFYSSGQPDALSEAYPDILAAFADGDWVNGDIFGTDDDYTFLDTANDPVRDMQNPPANFDEMSDFQPGVDEHDNSNIFSHAAYLIATGGENNNLQIGTGIGMTRMGHLFYWSLFGTPANGSFLDSRNAAVSRAMIWASTGVRQFDSAKVCVVRNGFASIGIGKPDFDCDGVEETVGGDFDNDGVSNANDNCPQNANPLQHNKDFDEEGDACDEDDDNDGVNDADDNCPTTANPDQTDEDEDGHGAACDFIDSDDVDNDSILNDDDNCMFDYNPNQANIDNDDAGDACDTPDYDEDGISDDNDLCPNLDSPTYLLDTDGDGVTDTVSNADTWDEDGDGIGDFCDVCRGDYDYGAAQTAFQNPITGEVTIMWLVPDDDEDGIPNACDEGRVTIGRFPGRPRPDCESRPVQVIINDDGYFSIPIEVDPGDPPDGFPEDRRVVVLLEGLPGDIHTWVLNDEGFPMAEPELVGAAAQMRFRPFGGQKYFLAFQPGPDYHPGDQLAFDLQLSLEEANSTQCVEKRPLSLPIPTAAPTRVVLPTVLPTLTPTFTPVPPTPIPPPFVQYTADTTQLTAGQCTTVRWITANIGAVYFEGQPTVGEFNQPVCPAQTEIYDLLVYYPDGTQQTFSVQINVTPLSDRDGDGVPDEQDRCPDQAGPAESGGCLPPPPDRDGDSVPDDQDRCPDESGPGENGGCPRRLDRDGDTVLDEQDRCPDVAGIPENQGCPRGQ